MSSSVHHDLPYQDCLSAAKHGSSHGTLPSRKEEKTAQTSSTLSSEQAAEQRRWVFAAADPFALAGDLCRYVQEKANTRKFKDLSECYDFMRRVHRNKAKPLVFKDFNYHGKVEREVWFHDPFRQEGLHHVIVHIHFADAFDEVRHQNRQLQQTSTVTAINLRHYTNQPSGQSKSSHYESIFKNTYLEGVGVTIKVFKHGWRWRQVAAKNTLEHQIQCFQEEKMQGIHLYHEGDEPLDINHFTLHRTIVASDRMSTETELETIFEFMNVIEIAMMRAPLQDFVQDFAQQDMGIEVLTIGNDNYSLVGLENHGKLKNAVADATAIAQAFRKLGAHVQTEINIRDVKKLEEAIYDWADTRLVPNRQFIRVVFLYWAGHAFHCKKDGLTHILPTGDNWNIKRLCPGRDTMPVKDIINIIRQSTKKSKLIVCLDSCRTEMKGQDWSSVQSYEQGGPDSQSHKEVEIWYSTSHGEPAGDGEESHSHFTESILSCLQGNLHGKTFDAIWRDIYSEMQKRNPEQLPSIYKVGLSEHETLLPKLAVPMKIETESESKVSTSDYFQQCNQSVYFICLI
jgi:hypothetical protein